jgi:hypothetical protein
MKEFYMSILKNLRLFPTGELVAEGGESAVIERLPPLTKQMGKYDVHEPDTSSFRPSHEEGCGLPFRTPEWAIPETVGGVGEQNCLHLALLVHGSDQLAGQFQVGFIDIGIWTSVHASQVDHDGRGAQGSSQTIRRVEIGVGNLLKRQICGVF